MDGDSRIWENLQNLKYFKVVRFYLIERAYYLLMDRLAMGTVEAMDVLVLLASKEAVGDSISCLLSLIDIDIAE